MDSGLRGNDGILDSGLRGNDGILDSGLRGNDGLVWDLAMGKDFAQARLPDWVLFPVLK